ncbi:MAG: leucine-rich repeat protein [Clostridia bacterium]|nr:leucine-rich repeat protein [Clostridia bacterium]
MKKAISLLLTLLLVTTLLPTSRVSGEAEGDYEYIVNNGEAIITGYIGSGGDIAIPSTLGGYPVTGIGGGAFLNCYSLTSVTIPDSVTSIGLNAFRRCTSLTSVTIPDSVISIGDWAFSWCSSLREVIIPDSVTSIGEATFHYCTSLTEVILPNSVISIGDGAFLDCYSLTEVTIPDSVTSIGDWAFSHCFSLTEVTLPDSLTSIGYGPFSNCSSLTSIKVGDGNPNYKDMGGVLFSKDGTALIQYPAGKTDSSYAIPESVTSIGEWAFSDCDSLTGVTIPDSVTSIYWAAFHGCISLNSVIFEGRPPSTFGANVFYNCAPEFTIYYSAAYANAWAPSGATFWYGYPIKALDYSTSLSSDMNKAFIKVVDATTKEPLVGAQVSVSQSSGSGSYLLFSDITDSTGVVEMDMRGRITCKIKVTMDGYASYESTQTLSSGNLKEIKLKQNSTNLITSVLCDGVDVLSEKIEFPLDEDDALKVEILHTYSQSEINGFELIQGEEIKATSSTGEFELKASTFDVGVPIWVRVKLNNGSYSKPIRLGISIYNRPLQIVNETSLEIMDALKITIPSDVPLLGGEEIEIDLGRCSIAVEMTSDKIKIGFGVTEDFDPSNDSLWHSLKNSTINRNIDKGLSMYHAGTFGTVSAGNVSPQLSIYGYVEGKRGAFTDTISGNLVIEAAIKYNQEWQTAVWIIPVVIKLGLEIGIKDSFSIYYDEAAESLRFNDTVEFTSPAVELSAGIGIAYIADISVYGSAANKIGFNMDTGYRYGKLEGEAGLSARALFWSGKWTILSGTWMYYENYAFKGLDEGTGFSLVDLYDSAEYTIASREYLDGQSGWLGAVPVRDVLSAREETLLQSGIYEGARPQMISAGGNTVMVYLADDGSRTTGNHTKLVYSVYNESNNTWSAPLPVWDDGTADFNPTLATDGTNVYIAWMDANATFGEDVTMEQMAAACEISVAKLTFDNGSCTCSDRQRITANSMLDMQPCMVIDGGKPVVVWSRNSGNDILAQAGSNTVLYAEVGGNENVAANLATPVCALSAGLLNGEAHICYVTDTDGDINTAADNEVYVGGLGQSFTALTQDELFDSIPTFAKRGTENVLYWLSENGMNVYDGENIRLYEVDCAGDYRVISDGSETTYLMYPQGEGEGASLYISRYEAATDTWSEAITLTDTAGYAESPAAVVNELGGILSVYVRTDAVITEDEVKTSSDLYAMRMVPSYNLVLNDVDFYDEDVALGATLPLTLTVSNEGEKDIEGATVTVSNGDAAIQSFTIDSALSSGETDKWQVECILPDNADVTDFTFTVIPKMEEGFAELDSSDNVITEQVFFADIGVLASKTHFENENSLQLTVSNEGFIASDATLVIHRNTVDGEVLATHSFSDLQPQTFVVATIDGIYLDSLMEGSECLYFEVLSSQPESMVGNNTDFVAITEMETEQWQDIVETLYGDADGNGRVEAADAAAILRYVVKIGELTDLGKTQGDVAPAFDGKPDSSDAAAVLRRVVQLITIFPIEEQ